MSPIEILTFPGFCRRYLYLARSWSYNNQSTMHHQQNCSSLGVAENSFKASLFYHPTSKAATTEWSIWSRGYWQRAATINSSSHTGSRFTKRSTWLSFTKQKELFDQEWKEFWWKVAQIVWYCSSRPCTAWRQIAIFVRSANYESYEAWRTSRSYWYGKEKPGKIRETKGSSIKRSSYETEKIWDRFA